MLQLTKDETTKLTDAAMHSFTVLHGVEIRQRKLSKALLAAELRQLDLFGPSVHYTGHEDYVPGGGES